MAKVKGAKHWETEIMSWRKLPYMNDMFGANLDDDYIAVVNLDKVAVENTLANLYGIVDNESVWLKTTVTLMGCTVEEYRQACLIELLTTIATLEVIVKVFDFENNELVYFVEC